MNVRTFLNDLLFYFPPDRKINEAETEKLLDAYVEDITAAVKKCNDYTCDYYKLLQYIRSNYTYKNLPSISQVIKYLPKGLVEKPKDYIYSGKEGEVIKRVINGHKYEFTIVPNHWDKVMTINELD